MHLRACLCGLLLFASIGLPAQEKAASNVYVESWQTLVRSNVSVTAGQAVQYNFTLPNGAELLAQFQVQGGLNNQIRVLLLDFSNYRLYASRQPYRYYQGTSGTVRGIGQYRFRVPGAGTYFIVLDNGRAWFLPRTVTLHVDAILPERTTESEQLRAALQNEYSSLSKVFVFRGFSTYVQHCGVENAFSNPDIHLCVELLESMQSDGFGKAIEFVYLHELGHTLMKEWGLPLWDNEDAAGEFATALLLMGNQQNVALDAAQYWSARRTTSQDAIAKIWQDDRHSLSPQRARNIIRWVNNREEIIPRWQHLFVPNMQTAVLERMVRDANVSDKDEIRSELQRRGASGSYPANYP